jgi:hypothetical protein
LEQGSTLYRRYTRVPITHGRIAANAFFLVKSPCFVLHYQ